jgi:hypothetical protein
MRRMGSEQLSLGLFDDWKDEQKRPRPKLRVIQGGKGVSLNPEKQQG